MQESILSPGAIHGCCKKHLHILEIVRWAIIRICILYSGRPELYGNSATQYAEQDLNKTSNTLTETLIGLFLMA